MIVRSDGLPDEYLVNVVPHQRNDLLRNDCKYNDPNGFLPATATSQPSQRLEIGVRNDVLADDFIPNSSQQQQRIDLGARNDGGLSTGYLPARVRNDGLPGDYLPTAHRGDTLSSDFLPASQSMVADVQFVASSAMFDYDFIVSDVATPEVGLEPEPEAKFFTQRQFLPDHQHQSTTSVLDHSSSAADGNSCQVLQQQQQQQQQQLQQPLQHEAQELLQGLNEPPAAYEEV